MGCGKSTASKPMPLKGGVTSYEDQDVQNAQGGTVDKSPPKKKELNDNDWWRQVQEEYKKEKESHNVNMNRGWANPFGQPALSKDVLLGKSDQKVKDNSLDMSRLSNHKKSVSRSGIEHNNSNVNTTGRNKTTLEPPTDRKTIHETEDFIFNDNKSKGGMYGNSSVRRNVDGYDDLIENDLGYNNSNTRPAAVQDKPKLDMPGPAAAEVKISTIDYSKPKGREDINDLMKELDSDDDMPSLNRRNQIYNKSLAQDYQKHMPKASPVASLGKDFNRSLGKAGNNIVMGNNLEARYGDISTNKDTNVSTAKNNQYDIATAKPDYSSPAKQKNDQNENTNQPSNVDALDDMLADFDW